MSNPECVNLQHSRCLRGPGASAVPARFRRNGSVRSFNCPAAGGVILRLLLHDEWLGKGFEVKPMIIRKAGSAERLEISVWMDPSIRRVPRHRHDLVMLTAEPGTGTFRCIALADFGLPVLQPQTVEFASARRFGELFLSRADTRDTAESLAVVLATAALLRLTGVAGRMQGRSNPPTSEVDVVSRFENFLNRGTATAPPDVPTIQGSDSILVSEKFVLDGIESGILNESEGTVRPHRELGIDFRTGESALDWAKFVGSEMNRPDYRHPEGFRSLDMEAAARALTSISAPSATSVWFFGDALSPHHSWRQQSAASYPALAEFMTQFDDCRKAIDAGRPLQPVISGITRLNKGQLKRLGKLRKPLPSGRVFRLGEEVRGLDPMGIDRARRYSLGNELSLEQLLSLIREFDTNWVPADEKSWARLIDIVSCCIEPIRNRYALPARGFLAASKGNWVSLHAQLATAYECGVGDFDRQQMSMASSDVLEMIDDFSLSVVLPRILGTILESGDALPFPASQDIEAAKRLGFNLVAAGSRNPTLTLLEAARRWMGRIPALIAAEGQGAGGEAQPDWESDPNWPRLAEDFQTTNGLSVQNLVSEEELLEESRRLSHCVGRLYTRKARRGECHIFSVRSLDGSKSHSTFEIAPFATDNEQLARNAVQIVQHKARSNRRPGTQATAAVDEWLTAFRSNTVVIHLENVRNWRSAVEAESPDAGRAARSPESAWSAVLGRNWRHADVLRAVWGEWGNHVLRGEMARSSGSDVIFESDAGLNLLARLNPNTAKKFLSPTGHEARRSKSH